MHERYRYRSMFGKISESSESWEFDKVVEEKVEEEISVLRYAVFAGMSLTHT